MKTFRRYFPKLNTLYDKLFLNYLAIIILNLIYHFKFIKPYHISIFGFFVSISSAIFFALDDFILAIILFQFVLVLDLVDGKISKINNSSTMTGIIIDSYFDFLILVMNAYALLFSSLTDILSIYLINIFLILNYAEAWMDKQMIQVYYFLKKKKKISINSIDKLIIRYINYFKRFELKGIFFSYHERYFLIFVLGVYFNQINTFLLATIIIMIVTFHLKIIFEVTIIKNSIINNDINYLGFRDKN